MSRPQQRGSAASASLTPSIEAGPSTLLLSLDALKMTDEPISAPPDICPVCKSSRYLNPNMRFLVNPECYHKMCESCVDRIFSHGPAPCPIAGCHRTLRKQRFRKQTFEDIQVEKEVDVRKRVAQTFNRRPEEFESLLAYNNYLEEVETITFDLLNGIDAQKTEAKLAAYAAQNAASISHNTTLEQREHATAEARQAAEKEQARLRREAARREEDEERRELESGRKEVLDRLARGDGDADNIAREGQKVLLKRSSARRQRDLTQPSNPSSTDVFRGTSANGAADTSFFIKGLKPTAVPEPEKPYDPFGGLSLRREYFTLQDFYEHPWLDAARTDLTITSGGYDVQEYCTRTLTEAFSGLGVFIEDEVAGREKAASGSVATVAAAAAGGGDENESGDVL
ncbi:MAG: TFIIH/NER complex subunit [Caeruleum heppii]|nr:MAG: TFIIH/NER complex subunit [Caeruleum heppii]